jgi:three-Cys-motif partner protein
MGDFHKKPFDAGTLVKLEIFELYLGEWLPVFLASREPFRGEVHIFDFFAGPGLDPCGQMGSPLRVLRTIRRCLGLRHADWPTIQITAHFSDVDSGKIESLRRNIESHDLNVGGVELDLRPLSFQAALRENAAILRKPDAAKLLLIDQCGVDQVTPEIFGELVVYPTTDFLFFISSSTLHRFHDHPAIKLKIERPTDYYHVHRKALEYYRELLPQGARYFLAPFSIKKDQNIYMA